MTFSTADLSDNYEDARVLEPILRSFGGRATFSGRVLTVKCHEDNSLVKELASTPGLGRVLVVDGGGSVRKALLGDMVARSAVDNGWSGMLINGAVRDVEALRAIDLGIHALASIPVRTEKLGRGDRGVPVTFGSVMFREGDFVYADATGVVLSNTELV